MKIIVVGSGPAGGRLAYELTKQGAQVTLLEAGRHFEAGGFPKGELRYSSQMFWGGGVEMNTNGSLGFLRAKCVGGTSVVNQALLDEFDEEAFRDWRQRSGISDLSTEAFKPLYEELRRDVPISEIPKEHWNPNTHIFTHALEKLGYGWKALTRAQKDCALDKGSDCIVCLGGCPRESKQSSLVTTVRKAKEKGAELLSEFEVWDIHATADGVTVRGFHQKQEKTLQAQKLVLAAGSLGNSTILLRSGLKKSLPALGTGFTCHPQYMTYAYFDRTIDAHKGAFQAVKSYDPNLRKAGFKLENVFGPPIATAMLLPGYGKGHLAMMHKYRSYASMEVALRDEASGELKVDSSGRLTIHKQMTGEDLKKGKAGLKLVREFFEAEGAQKVIPCMQPFGLHLMGGLSLGTDGRTSVVGPDFRVHGFKNIFAADSSVFPSAPGINPSFTIMALALKASKEILK